jgi:hypothetical protein
MEFQRAEVESGATASATFFLERELKPGWIKFVYCHANDVFALHTLAVI